MNLEKTFENLQEKNQDLWTRISEFAEELQLNPEDYEMFVLDNQVQKADYSNKIFNKYISVGSHLARAKKIREKLEFKKDCLFGNLYKEITDECLNGKASSKYDQDYRKGKVLNTPEYKELVELVIEFKELENNLETAKAAMNHRAMQLPTLLKQENNLY